MKHQWHKKIIILIAALIVAVPAITYAASVFKGTNTVKYNAINEPTEGEYKVPTQEGYMFDGWNTESDGSGTGVTPSEAANPTISSSFYNSVKKDDKKTLYAQWRQGTPAKYAVAIYGINADGDKTITFGPAVGGDYVTTSKAPHIEKNEETSNNMCIHNHTWSEIISQIRKNPTAFNQCIANGCTKTVDLAINDTLKGKNWSKEKCEQETGDGPSILKYELKGQFRVWQPGTGEKPTEEGNTKGGWPASRIRAVLNGNDNSTIVTTSNNVILSDEGLTQWSMYYDITPISNIGANTNCLLTCFPKELQKAICAKKVQSYIPDTNSYQITEDRLWLFAVDDLKWSQQYRAEEKTEYQKNFNNWSGYYYPMSSYDNNTGYWMLRSAAGHSSEGDQVYVGSWFNTPQESYTGNGSLSVAPGFIVR